jgi:DNA-binding MarR family transcriptional regulator
MKSKSGRGTISPAKDARLIEQPAKSRKVSTRKKKKNVRAQAPLRGDPIALGDLSKNLGYRIRRAQLWVFKDVSRQLAPFDISIAQYSVLSIINTNPGINQLAIASVLSIERAGLGRLVERLEQRGLVARAASSTNRRYYVLHLTAAGVALLDRLRSLIARHEEALAEKLGPRAYKELLRTLSIFLHE